MVVFMLSTDNFKSTKLVILNMYGIIKSNQIKSILFV